MAVRNPTCRTSSNSVYKNINGKSIWLHQVPLSEIEDVSKYGKHILYQVMKKIENGKILLNVPAEFEKDSSYHFFVQYDRTLRFEKI